MCYNGFMNIEFERKFKTTNKDTLKSKLLSIGAESKGIKFSEDTYFKVPQKVESTKYLRIRIKNNESDGTLAYHEVVNDFETKEWETDIDNAIITKDIIEKLGFHLDVIVNKTRETLIYGKCEIVLDSVKNLGDFVEIEAPSKEAFDEIATKLNLDDKDVISGAGYPDLLKRKNEIKR